MKISELIAELEKLKEEHGDIFCISITDKGGVVEAYAEYRIRPEYHMDAYPIEFILI